jgi:hypothetical protein
MMSSGIRVDIAVTGRAEHALKDPQAETMTFSAPEGDSALMPMDLATSSEEGPSTKSHIVPLSQPPPEAAFSNIEDFVDHAMSNLCSHIDSLTISTGNAPPILDDETHASLRSFVFVSEDDIKALLHQTSAAVDGFPSVLRSETVTTDGFAACVSDDLRQFATSVGLSPEDISASSWTFENTPRDMDIVYGWGAGSLTANMSERNLPQVDEDSLAGISIELADAAASMQSLRGNKVFCSIAGNMEWYLEHPLELLVLKTDLCRDGTVAPCLISASAEGEAQVWNAASALAESATTCLSYLSHHEGTHEYAVISLFVARVVSVCDAAKNNDRVALRNEFSTPFLVQNLDDACLSIVAHSDFGYSAPALDICAHVAATAAMSGLRLIGESFLKIAAGLDSVIPPSTISPTGLAVFEATQHVRDTVNAYCDSFSTSVDNLPLLGYLPVTPPRGVSQTTYGRTRRALLDQSLFPSCRLFSPELIALDEIVGTGTPEQLRQRADATLALAALPPNWARLLSWASVGLSEKQSAFVFYSPDTKVSGVLAADITENLIFEYSSFAAAVAGFETVFMRELRFSISNSVSSVVPSVHPTEITCLPPFMDASRQIETVSVAARAMYNAGIIPVVMNPGDSGRTCGAIAPFALWPIVNALQDANEFQDLSAKQFLASAKLDRLVCSFGGVHNLSVMDEEFLAGSIFFTAVFTFEQGASIFSMRDTLAEMESTQAASLVMETIDPLVSLLIFRFCVAVFVSSAMSTASQDILTPVAAAVSEDLMPNTDLVDFDGEQSVAISEFLARALNDQICVFSIGARRTKLAFTLAAALLTPHGLDSNLLHKTGKETVLDLGLEELLDIGSLIAQSSHLIDDTGLCATPWVAACRSFQVSRVVRVPGDARVAQISLQNNQITRHIHNVRDQMYSSDTIRLPPGFSGTWTTPLAFEFLCNLGTLRTLGRLAMVSETSTLVLDAGESRDALTPLLKELVSHSIFVAQSDGTFRISDRAVPLKCAKCDRPTGCELHDEHIARGLAHLFLLCQTLMSFPLARVGYKPKGAEFTIPFRLDFAQAFFTMRKLFGTHPGDHRSSGGLDPVMPVAQGVFQGGLQCGSRMLSISIPEEVDDDSLCSESCFCTNVARIPSNVDEAWALAHPGRCPFHIPRRPGPLLTEYSAPSDESLSLFGSFLAAIPSLSQKGPVFAKWYSDLFPNIYPGLATEISLRLRFTTDRDIDAKKQVLYKMLASRFVTKWVKQLSDEEASRFLIQCTAQASLPPDGDIIVCVTKNKGDENDARNLQVEYKTCFRQLSIPEHVICEIFRLIDSDSDNYDEVCANLTPTLLL